MKKCLITGGSGFLGRGILRKISRGELDWDPTILSRDEYKQFLCQRRYPSARYVLGDIKDIDRLSATMTGHDFVVHAAAIKFVDKAELNAAECIAVNVGGTVNVIKAAKAAGVQRVVGISTDKAVKPVNIYGCSKMAMERLFAESSNSATKFVCVRYGNVVGSTGSVIPLFQRQFEEEGKVKLTNPNMTRFWMSVDEAVKLIELALSGAEESPGAVFIPLVKAMPMSDVVLAAVGEVPVEIIGERPGEKEHEALVHYQESVRVIKFVDHYRLLPAGSNLSQQAFVEEAGQEPFTLSSHTPHYHMSPGQMREFIEDSKEV